MQVHRQSGGAEDTSLGPKNIFPENGLMRLLNFFLPFCPASSCRFIFFRFLAPDIFSCCIVQISECFDKLISNTFSKKWEKHFDTYEMLTEANGSRDLEVFLVTIVSVVVIVAVQDRRKPHPWVKHITFILYVQSYYILSETLCDV